MSDSSTSSRAAPACAAQDRSGSQQPTTPPTTPSGPAPVAKTSPQRPGIAGQPSDVPDHAFEKSVAGEEDPGASLDNDANGVPPPKGRAAGSTP